MTRSGVGRSQRTASRLAYAPPIGEGSLALLASQAAAERIPGRANRTAVRLGLRTLVVAGFAGAAWLLCANAAQAADAPATDRTTGLSAVDLVTTVFSDGVDLGPTSEQAASATLVAPVADAVTSAHQPVLGVAPALLSPAATRSIPFAEPAFPAGATDPSPATRAWDSAPAMPAGGSAPAAPAGDSAPDRSASNGAGQPGLPGAVRGLLDLPGLAGRSSGSASLLTSLTGEIRPVGSPLYGPVHPTADAPRRWTADGAGTRVAGHASSRPRAVRLAPTEGPGTTAGPSTVDGEWRTPPAGDGPAAPMVTAARVNGDHAAPAIIPRATATAVTRALSHSAAAPVADVDQPAAELPVVRCGHGRRAHPAGPHAQAGLGRLGALDHRVDRPAGRRRLRRRPRLGRGQPGGGAPPAGSGRRRGPPAGCRGPDRLT